jgi:hypothetical protein
MNKTGRRDVKAEAARRAAMYHHVFTSPDGQKVLDDLQRQFGGTTLRKHEGVIDPNASLAAAGCREVVLYIQLMMEKSNVVD